MCFLTRRNLSKHLTNSSNLTDIREPTHVEKFKTCLEQIRSTNNNGRAFNVCQEKKLDFVVVRGIFKKRAIKMPETRKAKSQDAKRR